jgi:hypothetical protein
MRMSQLDYEELRTAIGTDMPRMANERQRWDALWRAVDAKRFDVNRLYKAGLNDAHIDTALKRIAAE